MVQMNFARKEVKCKIVYYGPGLSGKTTNIEVIHDKAPSSNRGELTSIATEGDRTLFFDFMPLDLGKVHGMDTKFKLYTVPGQVYYNSTRKLVLQGADGVVFVADSQRKKMQENLESLENLQANLTEYGLDISTIPLILQYNKRDLPDVMSVEELNEKLNPWGVPHFEAVAFQGVGVFPTLKALVGQVLARVNSPTTSQRPPKRPGAAPGAAKKPAAAPPPGAAPRPPGPPPGAGGGVGAAPRITASGGGASQAAPPRPGGMAPPRPGGMAPPPRPGGMAPPPRPGGMAPPPRPGGMAPPPPRPGGMAPPPRPGGMAPPPRPGGMAPPPPRPGGMAPPPRPGGMAPPVGSARPGGPPPPPGKWPPPPVAKKKE